MKSAIIVFPGSNREKDMAMAIKKASGHEPQMIWYKDTEIPDVDLIALPGGFSYGDYLRCGAMAANAPIMKPLRKHAERGTRIFGVCNGFQILIETQLLPGALLKNAHLKFVCKRVDLSVESNDNDFLSAYGKGDIMNVPVAHGEGNYFADDAILKTLQDKDLIALRYDNGTNPNGSADDIAGIFNEGRNVLGMMPHPEDAIDPTMGGDSGHKIFQSMVEALS